MPKKKSWRVIFSEEMSKAGTDGIVRAYAKFHGLTIKEAKKKLGKNPMMMAPMSYPKPKKKASSNPKKKPAVVGKRLASMRKKYGLSQEEMAKILRRHRIKVSATTLGKWERGGNVPYAKEQKMTAANLNKWLK